MPLIKQRRRPPMPRVGDVFAVRTDSDRTVLGRVIRDDAKALGFTHMLMLYFFDTENISVIISPRATSHLLTAPILTDLALWKSGYVVPLESVPLGAGETLQKHCFYHEPLDRYVDEYDVNVPRQEKKLCGHSGLTLIPGISREIDMALAKAK